MSIVMCANCSVICEPLTFGVCRNCNRFYCWNCLRCVDNGTTHDSCVYCDKQTSSEINISNDEIIRHLIRLYEKSLTKIEIETGRKINGRIPLTKESLIEGL